MKVWIMAISLLFSALTALAQDGYVPITHKRMLVGGVRNGKWIKEMDVPKTFSKPSKFIGFDSFASTRPSEIYGTGGEMGCGATYFYFDGKASIPADVFAETGLTPVIALGADADWNPLPRRAKRLSLTESSLKKIALDFLKSKGIVIKNIKLESAVSVDLEGDGSNEIFLEATNYLDKNGEIGGVARKGGYSFVMMRRNIGGRLRDTLVAGEFFPGKPVEEDYISEVGLSQFADLNGDGKLEIVLETIYSYGGTSSEIFEVGKSGLKNVLSAECGD